MITTGVIKELPTGVFSLFLEPCSALVLQHVLSEDVPFVWLEGHLPNTRYKWWRTAVPLSKGGALHELEVRLIQFDAQFTTNEFLQVLPEFAGAGITLFQTHKRWPATLTPRNLNQPSRHPVLIQNGLHLSFDLPHAGEYACVASPHREVLERINNHPVIASGDLP